MTTFYRAPAFATVDQCKEKDHKVRIRRIQSSGSKRKFPRDFFSRESHKPNRNATLKENHIGEYLEQETGCFATINQPERNQVETEGLETPKFREKSHTDRVSAWYKNQTLKESIKKFVAKKQQKEKKEEGISPARQGQVNSFENTFSGNQFKTVKQECNELDLRAVLKPDKENLPVRRMKASKENFIKKFSIMKPNCSRPLPKP